MQEEESRDRLEGAGGETESDRIPEKELKIIISKETEILEDIRKD